MTTGTFTFESLAALDTAPNTANPITETTLNGSWEWVDETYFYVNADFAWDVDVDTKAAGNTGVAWGIKPTADAYDANGITGEWNWVGLDSDNASSSYVRWLKSTSALPDWTLGRGEFFVVDDVDQAINHEEWAGLEGTAAAGFTVGKNTYKDGVSTTGWTRIGEDGYYTLCVYAYVTDYTDVWRENGGCADITIGDPCSGDDTGRLDGICSVEGTGNGFDSAGNPLPVPNASDDSESGASSLLYGAALALITAQLAF